MAKRKTAVGGPRRVRATQIGFYGLKRRRKGDVFSLRSAEDFEPKWMEDASGEPERETSAPEALRREHDEIKRLRMDARPTADGGQSPTGMEQVIGE